MRVFLLLALAGLSAAAPQRNPPRGAPRHFTSQRLDGRPHVPILVDERNGPDEFGNFNFRYQTGDGISHQAQGSPVGENSFRVQGSYKFTSPEGDLVEVRYVADENGFQAESPYLPTPPPIPAHALAQIRAAEAAFGRQRQTGGFQQQQRAGFGGGAQRGRGRSG